MSVERPTHMAIWPNHSVAAVSLAFDGISPEHLQLRDHIRQFDLRATFFCDAPGLLEDVAGWKSAAQYGHELGNHALLGAADPDGLIARMSADTVAQEVLEMRDLLHETFGVGAHSAALPLVKTWPDDAGLPAVPDVIHRTIVRLNEETLLPALTPIYSTIRTPGGRFNAPKDDLQMLRTCRIDGLDAVSVGLIAQIAISQQSWVILSANNANEETMLQIAKWLKRQPVWVAPVIEVANHLRESFRDAPTFHSV